MLMPEEELGSESPVSYEYEEDFEDLSHNADLYPDDNVDFSTLTPTELIKLVHVHDGKKGHWAPSKTKTFDKRSEEVKW